MARLGDHVALVGVPDRNYTDGTDGTLGGQLLIMVVALALFASLLTPLTLQPVAVDDSVRATTEASVTADATAPSPELERQVAQSYAQLPLSFVPNRGQSDDRVRYTAQGAGFGFFFTDDRIAMTLAGSGETAFGPVAPPDLRSGAEPTTGEHGVALHLRLLGASESTRLSATQDAPGTVSYFGGDHPAQARGLDSYGEITYQEAWPGIDMRLRGDGGSLKYEFLVSPGARPTDIALAYQGAQQLSLGSGGALRVHTGAGVLNDAAPVSYQRVDGQRVPVNSSYVLGSGNNYSFTLGAHDSTRPLVIDPGLDYSTFLGGTSFDEGHGIAVEGGRAYVVGTTTSSDYPTTPGAFDTTNNNVDAFVTALTPDGSALEYSTFLGGTSGDEGFGIALEGGRAHVTGRTRSPDYPTTPGAFDTTYAGQSDAFVTVLTPEGAGLVYSTFLGGTSQDLGFGIALDGGRAHVTGFTDSPDYPTTPGALDTTHNGFPDAFVTALMPDGSGLEFSTFLGGSLGDFGWGIALGGGRVYVTGATDSTDYPTTPFAYDPVYNGVGATDAFATALTADGSALVYSTFLGGVFTDEGWDIAVEGGRAYVAGGTSSPDYPATPGAFDETPNGDTDGFVTALTPDGSALVYSTYLGGSARDLGFGIAVEGGRAYVAGDTFSPNYPTTTGAFDESHNGVSDAFVSTLSPSGATLAYSTFLGGSLDDTGFGIAVADDSAYITGGADSLDYPTTLGAFDTTHNGFTDAFVTKLDASGGPGDPFEVVLTPGAGVNDVGTQHTVTATVTDEDGAPVPGVTVRFKISGSASASGECTTDEKGRCTFTYDGPLFPGADLIMACADSNGNGVIDQGEPCGEATKAWILPAATPGQVTGGGQVPNASATDQVAFGFNAKSDGGRMHGNCTVIDPSANVKVKCVSVTSMTQSGTHAIIFGRAVVNGVETDYRIDVDDLGEPGRDRDTFKIVTGAGYSAGGTLSKGNVQTH